MEREATAHTRPFRKLVQAGEKKAPKDAALFFLMQEKGHGPQWASNVRDKKDLAVLLRKVADEVEKMGTKLGAVREE